jgi:hypothetical protein
LTPPITNLTPLALRSQETGATSTDVHVYATAAYDEAIAKGYISHQSLLLLPLTPQINTISALAHRMAAPRQGYEDEEGDNNPLSYGPYLQQAQDAYNAAHAKGYISHHTRASFSLDSTNQHHDPTCSQDARNRGH